jgi:methyl-accepting chemotaxis protein
MDEFKDFAGEINTMVESLEGRFAALKSGADELAKFSKALRTAPNAAETHAVTRSMRATISSLNEQIQAFKI